MALHESPEIVMVRGLLTKVLYLSLSTTVPILLLGSWMVYVVYIVI